MFWNKLWPLKRPPRKRTAAPIELPDFWLNFTQRRFSGKIIDKFRLPGHSWTRNAYNVNFSSLACAPGSSVATFGAGHMSARWTGGTVQAGVSAGAGLYPSVIPGGSLMISNAANSTAGIMVGTGDTAWNIDDYILDALIVHGAGAGQLSYAASQAPTLTYASKIWTNAFARNFSNFSGASIFVKEVGLYSIMLAFGTARVCLLARDVLASAIEVEDETVLTVEFEISKDFSAID